MIKIIALLLIGYGLFEIFIRNLIRNYRQPAGTVREVLTLRMRFYRFRKSLPAYGAVLVGAFLLVASFTRG